MNSEQDNGDHYDDTVSEYTETEYEEYRSGCSDVEEDTSGECYY